MAGGTLYGLLMGGFPMEGVEMVFGIAGTVAGLISGALVGARCHRVDPLARR